MKTTKPKAPKDGYILPLWDNKGYYRATAQAYFQRENVTEVENRNGFFYSLEELESEMVNPRLLQT